MNLTEAQAKELIVSPLHKREIMAAKRQESQMRVFTEDMSKQELMRETYWQDFENILKKRSAKKYERVMDFARFPLPVIEVSDSILTDFYKVFDGKNRFFNVKSNQNIDALNEWIQNANPSNWVESTAKQVFKNKPISFVVVDIDQSGIPYLIHIDSERLIDAKFENENGDLKYIVFIHSQENHETKQNVIRTFYSIYDEMTYYVFYKDSDSDTPILFSSVAHGIGYCPAKCFIKTPSNSKNNFKRRVAFTQALSKFEDYTAFDIFRNYVDHYAPFPVTEAPERKCPNPMCQSGMIQEQIITDPANGTKETRHRKCNVCDGGKDQGQHIMPGTHIGIKVQSDASKKDGSGVFKMIFPDTDKLKYVPEKLEKLELEIRFKTVGVSSMITKEAINELQVKGSFESMESVLLRTKEELDTIYKWIVTTVANIYYPNIELEVEANFGTEFYLVTEEELQARYQKAKEIGMPIEELMMIYIQLIETKYKGNPMKIERQKMLLLLDPFPLFSINEVITLQSNLGVTAEELSLKINFLNFITKFETENAPITQFGINLELAQRIEIIKQTLNTYNNEKITSQQLASG